MHEPAAPPRELRHLADGFGLSAFELEVLRRAVAAELDPATPAPLIGELIETLPGGTLAAFQPDAPLRRARLVAVGDGPFGAAPIRADERIVHHVNGGDPLDERLEPYLRRISPGTGTLPASREEAVTALATWWADEGRAASRARERAGGVTGGVSGARLVLIHGPGTLDRRDLVARAALLGGRTAWELDAADIPRAAADRDALARLCHREHLLTGSVVLVELGSDPTPDDERAATSLAQAVPAGIVLGATRPVAVDAVGATLAVSRPTRSEQRDLWADSLPAADAASLASRFDLDHHEITARAVDLGAHGLAPGDAAASAARARIRVRLDSLAERIEPRATWDDLVVPAATERLLRHLAAASAGRARLAELGFDHPTTRGSGVTAMFAGPSGTGKTFAAEVIAGALGLDLYRVDLSAVVSKWIGETEKHLRRVFDAAEQGGVLLLFDEADAVFGRRSEVRDSHDRYANLEVSYLLARMESFRGTAVLTTNARSAIDPAFLRRLRVVVPFAHPDLTERTELWRRAFPAGIELDGLDPQRLARLDLTGGAIRTIAVSASLSALAAGAPVGVDHIRDAVAAEYTKHERTLTDVGAW